MSVKFYHLLSLCAYELRKCAADNTQFFIPDTGINTDEEGFVYAGVVDQILVVIEDFGGEFRRVVLFDEGEDLGADEFRSRGHDYALSGIQLGFGTSIVVS